ncbi:hypothetical protein N7478_001390 [Penicillium angulare]|uniref:uncharacterized protein n=1 Tax=Penicillium angulare TaxID=116970 RepID=UPI0025418730|nr:uncharacterized protein N7478_001390 [Penicillium angulare]KAJ5292139.1 hypothetical protein N7478_001390 [Penicillium angulare]
MGLLELPAELLIAIGDELRQSRTAVALASTNRALGRIFQPLAYKLNVQFESSRALLWAASQNSPHVMREILSYPGANVNTPDDRHRTPVFHAIRRNNLEILQILHTSSKVDYNWKDDRGRTPLIYALSKGQISMGSCLLTLHSPDLAIEDNKIRSALWYAVKSCNKAMVMELLQRGGDMKRSDYKGMPPLNLAIYKNHLPIVIGMLQLARRPLGLEWVDEFAYCKPLFLALRLGRLDIAQSLLSHGADPNETDINGDTALHVAISKRHEKAVAVMLGQARLEVTAMNRAGETALHAAAYYKYDAIFLLLLAAPGQNHEMRDNLGRTALHIAAEMGHRSIVRQLLGIPSVDLNGNKNPTLVGGSHRCDDDGVERPSTLHRAVKQRDIASASLLLEESRLNPNVYDDMGWTPLRQATYHGDLQMVDSRADVEVNTPRCPPLFYAAQQGHSAIVERLIKIEGIDIDLGFRGSSPLQAAARSGHGNITRMLQRKKQSMH